MYRLRFLIVILCGFTLLYSVVGAGMSSFRSPRKYRCVDVIDGDTVVLERGGKFIRVRLGNIDAPESSQRAFSGEPIGKMATQYLANFIKGQEVMFLMQTKDMYGRYVGLITHGGVNMNLKMVRDGWAIAYHYSTTDSYRISQSQAFIKRIGIWSTEGMLNPRLYRKQKRLITHKSTHLKNGEKN